MVLLYDLPLLLLSAAALPVSWQCNLISVYRGTHQCGECNNATFGTQSAAVLSSHAPHDSKARLQTKTNRRGSWRSHVHRARLRSACSSSSPAPTMAGSRGKAPCVLLGDLKGDILSRERMSLFARFPRVRRGKPQQFRAAKKKGPPFGGPQFFTACGSAPQ